MRMDKTEHYTLTLQLYCVLIGAGDKLVLVKVSQEY